MKWDFLVASTPLSGSAWLSNFLSHGDKIAFHDAIPRDIARPCGYQHVGNVDTSLTAVPEWIDWTTPRIALLTRRPEDIRASLAKYDMPSDGLNLLEEGAEIVGSKPDVYKVCYEEILGGQSKEVCSELWTYLFDEPMPLEHWERCFQLNVKDTLLK